jgi:hypothetical protein
MHLLLCVDVACPVGLIIATGSLLACSQPLNFNYDALSDHKFHAYTVFLGLFAFARVLHTVAYMRGVSSLRSAAWVLGVLANLGQVGGLVSFY